MSRQDIAVIGAGVSGIVAAHYLARSHRVVLFEAENRLGGHTNTIEIGDGFGQDQGLPVDTGFIVFNDKTYPNFIRFLGELGIQGAPTDMSFSYSDPARDFAYAGTSLSGLFGRRRQAFNPWYWSFLASVLRFNRRAARDLLDNRLEELTLEMYLEAIKAPMQLRRDYLGPMTQAIWSTSETEAMGYPAASFIRFFHNHGLLSLPGRVRWRYLKGGSRTYLRAFQAAFPGEIRLSTPVRDVRRDRHGPLVRFDGGEERFDSVVLAAHADQTLAMLHDADEQERGALGPWRYSRNRTVLHCDPGHMPAERRTWACWNVLKHNEPQSRQKSRPVQVTYWMNRLQRLNASKDWLVSLNAEKGFAPGSTVFETVYEHPVYSLEAVAAQKLLPAISGRRGTFFCGSYHGNGFHEDGARSAVEVVQKHFGVEL